MKNQSDSAKVNYDKSRLIQCKELIFKNQLNTHRLPIDHFPQLFKEKPLSKPEQPHSH